MYYYLYYLVARFTRKVNNRYNDFAFISVLNFGIPVGMTFILLTYFFGGKFFFTNNITLVIFFSTSLTFLILYFTLIKNKKYLHVIEKKDFDFKYDRKYIISISLFSIYILVLFFITFYLGYLNRNK